MNLFRSRRTLKENYRETEKAVLDSILGKGYDKRIRPSGQNITGNSYFVFLLKCETEGRNQEWFKIRKD